MTLQEAITSGKYFKRPLWKRYRKVIDGQFFFEDGDVFTGTSLPLEDFFATDYELKPEPRMFFILKCPGKEIYAFTSRFIAVEEKKKRIGSELIPVVEILE